MYNGQCGMCRADKDLSEFPKQSLLYGALTEERACEGFPAAGTVVPKQNVLPAGDVETSAKTKVAVAAKWRSVILKTCMKPMKMNVTFCTCSLVQRNIYDLLIYFATSDNNVNISLLLK